MGSGIDSQGNGNQINDDDGPGIQRKGYRQAFGDFVPNRLIIFKRLAETQRRQIFQPNGILHVERLIETVLGAPLGHRFVHGTTLLHGYAGAGCGAQTSGRAQLSRVTRCQTHD